MNLLIDAIADRMVVVIVEIAMQSHNIIKLTFLLF